MADVQNFITPEQTFPQLYQMGAKLERQREKEDELSQKRETQRKVTTQFIENTYDPNEMFTGTLLDPLITKTIMEIKKQAYDLSYQGADQIDIQMAVRDRVNRLSQYQTKAKLIKQQGEEAASTLKNVKGINVNKFIDQYNKAAFLDEQGNLRDVNTIDPNENYANKVLREGDIYTPEGFDEYISKAGLITDSFKTKVTDANKASRMAKYKYSAPEFLQPVKDEKGNFLHKFEPRHEYFTDNGQVVQQPVIDDVTGKPVLGSNGKPVLESVKMVTRDDWADIMRNPQTGAYIRQEIRKHAKELNIPVYSPQSEHFGRVLAFRILDQSSKSKVSISEDVDTKQPPIIIDRGGGSGKGVEPIDLTGYTKDGDNYNITSIFSGAKVTGLPTGKSYAPKYVLYNPKTKEITYNEYTEKGDTGEYGVGKEKKVSLSKFLQDIKTLNSTIDMKTLKGLENPIGVEDAKNKKPGQPKTVKRSSLNAADLKKRRYTMDEYITLLKQKGINVID